MKIRDIKDPRIQQMAIINAINENPELHLEHIMNCLLKKAFIWDEAPQGSHFWQSVIERNPFKYSEFGLFFKSTQGLFKQQVDELEFRCANALATPEEVYKHLKQKDVENKPKQEPMIYRSNLRPTPQQVDQIRLKDEIKTLKEEIEDWKKQHVYLSGEVDALKKGREEYLTQNDKLNKLVDEIEEELTKRAGNVFYPQIDLIELIHNYRNPSLVGTTQQVEIDGKKYEVRVNKEI